MLCFTCGAPLLAAVIKGAGVLMLSTALLLGALALLPYTAQMFMLPVPALAIGLSPFYLPLLIQAYEREGRHHSYVWYLLSSLGFYLVAGLFAAGGWWVWWYGPEQVRIGVCILLAFFAPIILFVMTCSPFIMFGYSYDPMVKQPHRSIWRHGIFMTVYEFPFIFMLFAYMAPLGFLVYKGPGILVSYGYLNPVYETLCMHIGSVLYWQAGWAAALVFYQDHKQQYVATPTEKDVA